MTENQLHLRFPCRFTAKNKFLVRSASPRNAFHGFDKFCSSVSLFSIFLYLLVLLVLVVLVLLVIVVLTVPHLSGEDC